MNNLPEIDLKARAALESAWLDFADLTFENSNYREQYYRLKFSNKRETHEEISLRERQRDKLRKSLQQQFTHLIRDGYFIAYGCYIGAGSPPTEHQVINKAFFDTLVDDFKIRYEENSVHAHGKQFVDVEILPNLEKLESDFPNRYGRSQNTDGSGTRRGKKMGRPVTTGVEDAIHALMESDPDFKTDNREPQCDKVREHLFGQDVDHHRPPKGYTDSAIKIRLRKLLPS